MKGVSEILQLAVIIKWRRPFSLEARMLEKLDFVLGRIAVEGSIPKEFLSDSVLRRAVGRVPVPETRMFSGASILLAELPEVVEPVHAGGARDQDRPTRPGPSARGGSSRPTRPASGARPRR